MIDIPVWIYSIHKNWNDTMHEYDSIKKYKDGRKFMNVIVEKKTEMERDI